jgi:hypothetical protein
MMRIIPKPGAPIRDPATLQRIPEEGFTVERVSAYWKRRAAEGGVTVTTEPKPATAAPSPVTEQE